MKPSRAILLCLCALVVCMQAYGGGGSVTVTSPNGGEQWYPGSVHAITWTTSGMVSAVKIRLLKNGVLNRWISGGAANDGAERWVVPQDLPIANDYRIQIYSASTSTIIDTSNANFSIALCPLQIADPNGGETFYHGDTMQIAWLTGGLGGNVKLRLLKAGALAYWISTDTPNDGAFHFKVPVSVTPGSDYRIQVIKADDGTVLDSSNGDFTLSGASITLTSPNGGESWVENSTHAITWTSAGPVSGFVDIVLYKGAFFNRNIALHVANTGTYAWKVPYDVPMDGDFDVFVMDSADNSVADDAAMPFSIASSGITVLTPTWGGEFMADDPIRITWKTAGVTVANVKIKLFNSSGLVTWVHSGTPNDGAFDWVIPSLPAQSDYYFAVYSATDTSLIDGSDYPFAIVTDGRFRILMPDLGKQITPGTQVVMRWTPHPEYVSVRVALYKNELFHSFLPGEGYNTIYLWNVPSNLALGDDYRLAIWPATDPMSFDVTDDFIKVRATSLDLTSPEGGSCHFGTLVPITWVTNGAGVTSVKIKLMKNGAVHSWITGGSPNTGTFHWTVPEVTPGKYTMQIYSATDFSIIDRTDLAFLMSW